MKTNLYSLLALIFLTMSLSSYSQENKANDQIIGDLSNLRIGDTIKVSRSIYKHEKHELHRDKKQSILSKMWNGLDSTADLICTAYFKPNELVLAPGDYKIYKIDSGLSTTDPKFDRIAVQRTYIFFENSMLHCERDFMSPSRNLRMKPITLEEISESFSGKISFSI